MWYKFSLVAAIAALAVALLFTGDLGHVRSIFAADPGPNPGLPFTNVWVKNTQDFAVPVAPQGTQDVNVVGGNLSLAPLVADKGFYRSGTLGQNEDRYYDLTFNGITRTLSLATLQYTTGNDVSAFELLGDGLRYIVTQGGNSAATINFPTRLAITRVHLTCNNNTYGYCGFMVNLVGN